jgi:hypothetical protein
MKISNELHDILNSRVYISLIKKSQKLIDEVSAIVEWTNNLDEQIYAVKFGIESKPKCPICKKELELKYSKGSYRYNKGCSIQHARETTLIEKYSVVNVFQLDSVKEKSKETCIKKYGVEYPNQNKNQLKKYKNTCIKKYGQDNYFKTVEFIDKRKQTCLDKFGVDHQMKSNKVKDKLKNTYIERFGVDNPSKDKDIWNKIRKNQNTWSKKEYVFPSGKKVVVMGYEPYVIDELLKVYDEKEIFVETNEIPSFNYIFNGKNSVYYPDIYIPKENLIIEVKSIYTYEKDLKRNLEKEKAVLSAGYNFKFEIIEP